jgi:hypothetical protein
LILELSLTCLIHIALIIILPSGKVITGSYPSTSNLSISYDFIILLETCSLSSQAVTNLVYVRYLDHLLFKHANPVQYGPVEREAVGWLVREEPRAVYIVTDRGVESELEMDSGLVILKSDILEMKALAQGTCVKYCSGRCGCCRVSASGKGSEKLGPARKAGGKQR